MGFFLVRSTPWILATAPQGGLLATPASRQRRFIPFSENPFIFYTACKRTFFISKFVRLLQDTPDNSDNGSFYQLADQWLVLQCIE
jgi:hypothetical protein